MKERHKEAEAFNARETLRACGIDPRADFYTLGPMHIDRLLEEADRVRYRKPKHANGSRARYFHARLQRVARLQHSNEAKA